MTYNTTAQLLKDSRKEQLLNDALSQHPKFLVERCIFEKIDLTIDDVDDYLVLKETMGEEVDRIWLLQKLSEGYVLNAPQHLIKKILKQ